MISLSKIYWIGCAAILIAGLSILIFSCEYPDNTVADAMPIAFGAGVDIIVLAIVGLYAGAIVKIASILLKDV